MQPVGTFLLIGLLKTRVTLYETTLLQLDNYLSVRSECLS